MIFNEKDKSAKLKVESEQFKNLSGVEKIKIASNLNKGIIKIRIAAIKNKNPNIKEKELLEELNKEYARSL